MAIGAHPGEEDRTARSGGNCPFAMTMHGAISKEIGHGTKGGIHPTGGRTEQQRLEPLAHVGEMPATRARAVELLPADAFPLLNSTRGVLA